MPLVSAAQMATLQAIGAQGLLTDVTIISRTEADTSYSDDEGIWTTVTTTVKGWLRSTPSGTIDVVGGFQATIGVFRLLLPVGTSIKIGDRVDIGGERYVVEDTIAESTYQVFLNCLLRRAQ